MVTQTKVQKSTAFLGVLALCGVLGVLWLVLLFLFLGDGEGERLQGVAAGQRLLIDVESGNISGTLHSVHPPQSNESPSSPESSIPIQKKKSAFDVGPEEGASAAHQSPSPSRLGKAALVGAELDALETIRAEPRTAISLAEAPGKGLAEHTALGVLPQKGSDGWPRDYYARPFEMPKPAKPVIALLVQNLGARKAIAEQALMLPPEISLAFSPYAKHAALWAQNARNLGHEAWLMLPAQPKDFPASDPGAQGLLAELAPEDNLRRLHQNMATFSGYAGVTFAADEVFTDHNVPLQTVLEELKKRGVALVLAAPPEQSAALHLLKGHQDMALAGSLVVDDVLMEEAIKSQLNALAAEAERRGHALGIVGAYPLSLRLVKEWIDSQRGAITLAPVSALLELQHDG